MKITTVSALTFCLLSTVVTTDVSADSSPQASSGAYLGVDAFKGKSNLDLTLQNTFSSTSANKNFDQNGFRIKLGARTADNLRFEVYLKSEDFKDAFDKNVYGIGLNVIKSFPLSSKLQPFVLGGFLSDTTSLEGSGITSSDDNLHGAGFKLGAGVMFPLSNHIEIMTGLDWQYRTWQDIEIVGSSIKMEQHDTSKSLYAGINFLF